MRSSWTLSEHSLGESFLRRLLCHQLLDSLLVRVSGRLGAVWRMLVPFVIWARKMASLALAGRLGMVGHLALADGQKGRADAA